MDRRRFLWGLFALAFSRRGAPAELGVDGIRHSPKEFTHPDDIEAGANVLLRSILAADGLALA